MPLPHVPDGPEKPFPLPPAHEPAPAAASPQAQLLAELWAKACAQRAEYWANVEGLTHSERVGALSALESTQGAVVAVLHRLYGVQPVEAQVRVQLALSEDQSWETLL